MSEPTPDRAVGEISDLRTLPTDQLMTRFMYALNPNPLLSFSTWKDLQAELFRRIAAGRPDADAKLRLQLFATERPADGVTISAEDAKQVIVKGTAVVMRAEREGQAEWAAQWDALLSRIGAALSAASDGGDCE